MTPLQYPLRSFTIPSGWQPIKVTTDIYTNSIIDNLYNQFSCCLGQKGSNFINSINKGESECDCCEADILFLIMALYVLRRWYNGGFSLEVFGGGNTCGVFNFYYVDGNGVVNTTTPLCTGVTGTSFDNFIVNLNLALPPGWTATYIPGSPNTVYISAINPTEQWLYITNTTPADFSFGAGNDPSWYTTDFDACLPYTSVQLIIQKCIQICGCVNCGTAAQYEKDNNYVPIGVMPPAAIPNPTIYTNPFFN